MIRFAVLLLNMLGLFIFRLFIADGVTIKESVPSQLKPGKEYTIEISIAKGGASGFAKLQQELPEGCSAVAMESKGASFTFSGNAVKYIWTSLPADPEFKITYKLVVAANAPTGEKSIGGKFFYVTDNTKQTVEVPESKVVIGEEASASTASTPSTSAQTTGTTESGTSAKTEPETTTNTGTGSSSTQPITPVASTTTETYKVKEAEPVANTNTAGNATTSSTTQAASTGANGLNCVRKITSNGGNEYTVELEVKRGSITGFAKLQENIPAGFSATSGQSDGAAFSFTDQKVKLVWVTLPAEDEFKVSYKLSGSASVSASIDGILSYIENDETKKFPIVASVISAAESSASANTATPIKTEPTATVTPTEPKTTETTETNTKPEKTTDNNLTTTSVPKPQTSVNYKVQICALRETPVSVTVFTARFGFSKVDSELHEGWTKYTVGNYNEYKEARDSREDVRGKGVVGPFVTAYNTGRRITVQEALMITSQKWYK